MVVPTFVRRALAGDPIEVHGDGTQRRCFAHVRDVVEALALLMECPAARGEVVNVGSQEEVTILELARRVQALAGGGGEIRLVPYDQAYGDGFEDMRRRVPALDKVRRLVGWRPRRTLDDILRDVIASFQESGVRGQASGATAGGPDS
jgi:UDP-glucose 4-epimerase